jgi:SAM-dependent methyltransferase
VYEAWGEKLEFKNGYFDLVFIRQALHHAKDLKLLCKEIYRVLKPGGIFMAIREHVISKKEDLPLFLSQHPLHKYYGGESAYLLSEYLDAIKSSGIKMLKVFKPYQSDINLFPDNKEAFKARLAKKLRLPGSYFISSFILYLLGEWSQAPGRLYSFIGKKHE